MASIAVRLQPKHGIPASKFQLRAISSSSSPVSPPASSSNETPASGEDSSSPLDSHFADIKSRPRQSAVPPRRIPLNPPKPDVLNASATKTTSLEEIRKRLSGFVRSDSSPKPMNSSSGNTSFMDLFNKSAPEKVGDVGGTNSDRSSFDDMRQTFRHLGQSSGEPHGTLGRSKGTQYNPMSLGEIRERLNVSPSHGASGSDRLPHSIFGKELEEESEDSIAAEEHSTEFLKMYTYSDLGEKLRKLRPAELVSGKEERKGSFSLHELNERLVRLKRMEVKQMEARHERMFWELKSCLSKLKEADARKKQTKYMLGEPKEHLQDTILKYFHLDLRPYEEKFKMDLKRVKDAFKMSESDCGSARVQGTQINGEC